jgi:hypothetical protein
MKWSLARAFALGLCLGRAAAIHVAAGSQCESLCGNVHDLTSPDDVVCKESDYASSAAGMVFQQCTTCQLSSNYVSGRDSDLQWLLCKLIFDGNDGWATADAWQITFDTRFRTAFMDTLRMIRLLRIPA